MELIKITKNEKGEQLVSARELYKGLGLSRQEINNWFRRSIVEDEFFNENKDYTGCRVRRHGNECQDYILKLDMAKHLCMMARTEKAKEIRNYFIECEKQLKEISIPSYQIENPIDRAKAWIEEKKEKEVLKLEVTENKPKIEFYEAVTGSSDTFDLGTVAKVINKKGYGRNNLFQFLRDKKVLMNNNQPYQTYIDREYFRIVETKFTKPSGDISINIKTLVYQKGVDYINKLLNKNV